MADSKSGGAFNKENSEEEPKVGRIRADSVNRTAPVAERLEERTPAKEVIGELRE